MSARPALVASLLLALACGRDPIRVQPPTFERPGSVDFLCTRAVAGTDPAGRAERENTLLPMERCAGLSGAEDAPLRLLALVTQTARGEVAAVDLRERRVLDADARVPGYTFLRVDETPTGIVVERTEGDERPRVFYVASFGGRRVDSYPIAKVLPPAYRVRDDAGNLEPIPEDLERGVALPDGPVGLVLAPRAGARGTLYAPLPRLGQIARISIDAQGAVDADAEVERYDLVADIPEPPAPPGEIEPFEKLCVATASGAGVPPAGTIRNPRLDVPLDVVPLGDTPQPIRLRVVDGELLAADANLPLIHRFAIEADGGLVALEPLVTGVPVRDFDVTPIVPAQLAEDGASFSSEAARYIYAIDATDDGSVLVVDYLPGSSTFGAVLPVQVGEGRPDRVRLPGPARTLAVLTPDYAGPSTAPSACTLEPAAAPTVLRGVFVAVGLSTGLVSIVDVHDLDAPCRGGVRCAADESSPDLFVYTRRHVTRLGVALRAPPIGITGGISVFFDGTSSRLDDSGRTPAGDGGPRLVEVSCPPFMVPVFPAEGTSLVCAIREPWSARAESWRAVHEGAIPGAVSFRARVARDVDVGAGRVAIEAPSAGLCRRGVLGSADVPASGLGDDDPEQGYVGDALVVTSDPPTSTIDDPGCARFLQDASGLRDAVFPIVEAFEGRVVLEDTAAVQALEACYPSLFSFEVRTRGVLTVVGTQSGFLHRVAPDVDGACRVDVARRPVDPADPGTSRNGRAFAGRPFIGPHLAFQFVGPAGGGIAAGTPFELSLSFAELPTGLSVDIGARGNQRASTIVEELAYSDARRRFYVLDANSDGFLEYELQPIRRSALIE